MRCDSRSFIRTAAPLAMVFFAAASQMVGDDDAGADAEAQYAHGEIQVPPAYAGEPVAKQWSTEKAVKYLEAGAAAWTREQQCITCHTNGQYMTVRPSLSKFLGKPTNEIYDFFLERLEHYEAEPDEELHVGVTPTALVYLASGLAEWDAEITGELSPATQRAFRLLFRAQAEDGSFANSDCWPPYESDNYHGAVVATIAMHRAPGYLKQLHGDQRQPYNRTLAYLKREQPPHDYAGVWLLWASTHVPDLIPTKRRASLQTMLLKHQQRDGGWSLRSFAAPEAWGDGGRAEKLRAESDFREPPSDGHMTGLAIAVLRDAGLPAEDPRLAKGIAWLESNQRTSGRWWTRSLNGDDHHYITYSGTMYPLLALAKMGRLPIPGKP